MRPAVVPETKVPGVFFVEPFSSNLGDNASEFTDALRVECSPMAVPVGDLRHNVSILHPLYVARPGTHEVRAVALRRSVLVNAGHGSRPALTPNQLDLTSNRRCDGRKWRSWAADGPGRL